MKLLLLGDLHFSLKSSSSRVDSIVEEFLYRFKDLRDKIAENGIMAVICTGDIFNTPYQSPETIFKLSKEIESLGIPFITAIGNHDEIGYRLENWQTQTSLGILKKITKNLHISDMYLGEDFTASFQHFIPEVDTETNGKYLSYYSDSKVDNYLIHVVHGYMVSGKLPFHVVNPSEIADTNADFVLAGHYHKPVYEKIKDKMFYNPGSFANLTYDDKDRICEVGLLDTSTNTLERLSVPYDKGTWVIKTDTKFKKKELILEETIVETDSVALITQIAKNNNYRLIRLRDTGRYRMANRASLIAWGSNTYGATVKLKLTKTEVENLGELRKRVGTHINKSEVISYLLTNFARFSDFNEIYDNLELITLLFEKASKLIVQQKFSAPQQERLITGVFLRDKKAFLKTLADLKVEYIELPMKSISTIVKPFFVEYFEPNNIFCIVELERVEEC